MWIKRGENMHPMPVELESAALGDGMGMEQGRGEAFLGTLCPQAFLMNPALCQQRGAWFQAVQLPEPSPSC